MEIQANKQLGVFTYQLLCEHLRRADKAYPHFTVFSINQLYDAMTRYMLTTVVREKPATRAQTDVLIADDAASMLYFTVLHAMIWSSLLPPDRLDEKITQLVPAMGQYLTQAGCPSLNAAEHSAFAERLQVFAAVPQDPAKLGASSNALYAAATENLGALRAGSSIADRNRRHRYKRTIFAYCMTVENADLAHRRRVGSLIAEALGHELRRSMCQNVQEKIDIFWRKFRIFYGGSRQV